MSRSNLKANGRFLRLDHAMLTSEAWLRLDAVSIAIYVEIATRYNGRNNGHIPFGCREAERRFHITRRTTLKAFERLQDAGLITLVKKGWFGDNFRRANCWAVTQFNGATGAHGNQ